MRAKTIQVVWHGKEPVYSLDFHPSGSLITGGADKEVKVWKVERGEDGFASVEHISSIAGHSKTVNCVRFSPTGQYLATSGDGGEMLLWQPSDGTAARGNLEQEDSEATWKRVAGLRGHNDDVMDLAWSTDGTALLSGSIDNKAIVWDMSDKRRGTILTQLSNHKHFVQGVAWDPAQQFVVTQSADRTCKVYTLRPPAAGRRTKVSQYMLPAADTAREFYCSATLSKRPLLVPGQLGGGEDGAPPRVDRQSLFLDESVPSFFRRLAWSPDGAFLVVPAGMSPSSSSGRDVNTAFVYARGSWAAPVMHLPHHSKPVVAVRFCPVLFRRDDDPQQPQQSGGGASATGEGEAEAAPVAPPHPFDLPYKMVFAVATLDSVVVYDTASALPLAVLGGLHYDSITDMSWSSDAQFLAIASRDCYCSIAAFDAGELGTPLGPADELPPHIAHRIAAAQHVAAPSASQQQQTGVPASSSKGQAPSPNAATHGGPDPSRAAADVSAVPGSAAASKPASGAVEQRQKGAMGTGVGADGRKRIQAETLATYQQPAAKKAKRIVPQAIGPAAAAAQAARLDAAAAAPPSAQAAAKPAAAPAASIAKPAPTDSVADAVLGSCGVPQSGAKQAKRITPTPLKPDGSDPSSAPFEQAKQASRGIVVDQSRDEGPAPSSTHRRITPIPVGAGTLLPSSSATPAPAAKAPTPLESALSVGGEAQGAGAKGGRVSIAALAREVGQQAAREVGKQARATKQKP